MTDKRPFARAARLGALAALIAGSGALYLSGAASPRVGVAGTALGIILLLAAPTLLALSYFAGRAANRLQAAHIRIAAVEDLLAALRVELAALKSTSVQQEKALAAISERQPRLEERVGKMAETLNTRASGEALNIARAKHERLEERVGKIAETLNTRASGEALSATRHIADKAVESAGKLIDKVGRLERAGRTYHVHNRLVSDTDIKQMLEEWAGPLGLSTTRAEIRYLADRVVSIEHQCAGRLATDIQTMLVRMLAAQSIPDKDARIIEIGVLFGIGAAAVYDACRFHHGAVRMTLIDPLEGYYDRSNRDIVTGVAVTRRALEHNLAQLGMTGDNIRILQGLSEEPETIAAMGEEQAGLLIIDGDHSYDGVKRDFDNYRGFVKPGGLVLFDDYDTENWPEIKTYVDSEVRPDADLEFVAAGFRTALFRVKSVS
jgi:predicted O-methyltransferase YrrM